jgi:hypothetical protein
MNERLDHDLDEMLSRHLHGCLDGQMGRAVEAFEQELSPRWRWRLGGGGVAVAAGLAVAMIVIANHGVTPKKIVRDDSLSPIQPVAEVTPPMLESAVWSKMTDDGTTLVDDRPMRQMRRKVVKETEWYDAKNGATVRTTQPQQQIYLIELKTN